MRYIVALSFSLISIKSIALTLADCDAKKEALEYKAIKAQGIEVSLTTNYLNGGCDLVNILTPKAIEGYSEGVGVGVVVFGAGNKIIEVGLGGGENSVGTISFPFVACSYVDHVNISVTFGKYCSSKEFIFDLNKRNGSWPKEVITGDDTIPPKRS